MDFSTWLPSHTNIVICVAVMFIGQVVVFLYRTGRLEKQLNKQGEELRKLRNGLEARIDKHINDIDQPIVGIRKEISDVRIEIGKLNQNHVEYLTHNN